MLLVPSINFLQFQEADETKTIASLQADVAKSFATDGLGPHLMLWMEEQRAIGECMIEHETTVPRCMGYASFWEHRERFRHFLTKTERDLREGRAQTSERLERVQNILVLLVKELDKDGMRYGGGHLRPVRRIR